MRINGVELENFPVGPLESTRKLGVETAMHNNDVDWTDGRKWRQWHLDVEGGDVVKFIPFIIRDRSIRMSGWETGAGTVSMLRMRSAWT